MKFLSPLKLQIRIRAKQCGAKILSCLPRPKIPMAPEVTVFIANYNTRNALKVTIESLIQYTAYKNYKLIVGDSGSTDGSLEYLAEASARLNFKVIQKEKRIHHPEWLNILFETIDTPYWCSVDSDMQFFGADWLADLVAFMEYHPATYLLSAEPKLPHFDVIEPVEGSIIDLAEAPSTWLFMVRTNLRNHIEGDFQFVSKDPDPRTKNIQCYDTGSMILQQMRDKKLQYAVMPAWYRCKYHHFGGLTWKPMIKAYGDVR